jgi:hypothetical protein
MSKEQENVQKDSQPARKANKLSSDNLFVDLPARFNDETFYDMAVWKNRLSVKSLPHRQKINDGILHIVD